jgi:hypothetical protein
LDSAAFLLKREELQKRLEKERLALENEKGARGLFFGISKWSIAAWVARRMLTGGFAVAEPESFLAAGLSKLLPKMGARLGIQRFFPKWFSPKN